MKDFENNPEMFTCCNCRMPVFAYAPGTKNRNHCPHCLWSIHIDIKPGDRMCFCKGKMEPISVWVKPNGEWLILHRCENCGIIKSNRIAGDDNEAMLISIAVKAIGSPPFPLEKLKIM